MLMMRQVLFYMILAAAAVGTARGGSIYAKREYTIVKPTYADDKANQIGDVLTILIDEETKIDNQVDREMSKDTSHSISLDSHDIFVNDFKPIPDIGVSASSDKSHTSNADYTDERTFEDRITVVVEDIHPNGNLVVIGMRTRDVAGDKQIIQVSGIVRPRDIAYDNTVSSSRVANFTLKNITEGPSKNYNNPGWLAGILDFLWPF